MTASPEISPEIPRKAWTIREVAFSLGLPERSVRTLIRSGALGHVMAGKHYLVPDAELTRYLERGIQTEAGVA